MLHMPVLETGRLCIRPFTMEDLPDVHRLLDIELHDADLRSEKMETLFRFLFFTGLDLC